MEFLPTEANTTLKFDNKMIPGLLIGYYIQPGGIWRGEFLVVPLQSLQSEGGLAMPDRTQALRVHRTKEIYRDPLLPIIFPLARAAARLRLLGGNPDSAQEDPGHCLDPLAARVGLAWHPELEGHPMRGPWAERLGTPTPIGFVNVQRQDDHNKVINLTEESPDWGGDEDQDMEQAPEEAMVDTSASSGVCGPAPIEREVGGACSAAPVLQSNNKDARVIDDGWLHYDAYDLPIASGKMDRRVADALPCKHTREMRRIADFNVPDNRPKSDLKINANDRHHADMSFKLVRLLRHDAWQHVLPMDSGGWVPLNALARFYGVDHEYLVCLAAACHMDANCRMEVAMAPRHPDDLSLEAGLGTEPERISTKDTGSCPGEIGGTWEYGACKDTL